MTKRILLFLMLLASVHMFAQELKVGLKYYKDENGKVIDEEAYEDLKKEIVDKFAQLKRKVRVKELFGATEQKGDSVIQSYRFEIIPLTEQGADGAIASSDFGDHMIGKPIAHTMLEKWGGGQLDMKEFLGKPTVINFWFTTCKPCIAEFPVLNKIQDKYKDKVNFVAITFEDDEKVSGLLKKRDFKFDKYINAQEYIDKLDIIAYPTTIFVDSEGIVRHVEGAIPVIIENGVERMDDGKEFEGLIEGLLK